MQKFSGLNYIRIAIANAYGNGLDKKLWDERIEWSKRELSLHTKAQMFYICGTSDEPLLMRNAVNAYYDAVNGKETGFIMGLDATASGPQLLACVANCKTSAEQVNLTNSGERKDCYLNVASRMSKAVGYALERRDIKDPFMTSFYGSKREPRMVFGKDTPELEAFYDTRYELFPGCVEVINDIQSCWDPTALVHSWTLPDGHTAYVPVTELVDKSIKLPDLGNASFTYRTEINTSSDYDIPIIANVTHSIDGYVVREMYRRAYEQGFELLTIHDSFWCSPNYMNNVRQNYIDILAEIAESNLLQDILREITGQDDLIVTTKNENIAPLIRESEYALS